jgi:hypothetical protein
VQGVGFGAVVLGLALVNARPDTNAPTRTAQDVELR